MRTAETILGLIKERGKKGLPLERVYKLLYNRDLYLMAYGKIYRNKGAMTHGVTDETPDGMSLTKIDAIIKALRDERYQWLPARRTYIPKKNGKKRPLGMPIWAAHCLSSQAMFGIPLFFLLVDQNIRSTILVVLYHKVASM
ncbi:MAG TPA: hypothetical protein VKB35_17615 [Ktedonobacteraceae bacterium]|nr:hypothetical protein [Ktedonobacteraceae bacterium]